MGVIMAVEVVFYSLAPKPAARGVKEFEAAASGKVSKGRKWYRLESRPGDVYQFPDNDPCFVADDVYDWTYAHPEFVRDRVAFTVNTPKGPAFLTIENPAALDAVQGGRAAVENAIALYEKGKGDGWVVFIPGGE